MQITTGSSIPVLSQIANISPTDWEEFILEWVTTIEDKYFYIENLSGSGDKGRDVVGFVDDPQAKDDYVWDNYQCKHYKSPLTPVDIWVEVGKVCYYSFIGEYPFPRSYFFICPKGIGTKLSDYLRKPDEFRKRLFDNWDKYCKEGITATTKVELTDQLKSYIESLDFSVFDKISPIKLINDHSKTNFHVMRFNTPLPDRPSPPPISSEIQEDEIEYVGKLIKAYNSHSNETITNVNDLDSKPIYKGHLRRSREDFTVAETLRNFSRDTLEIGDFEKIQHEVFTGVIDIAEDEHKDGFVKVKAVVGEARKLALGVSPLTLSMTTNDKSGICHQLANDGKLDWCKDEE